MDWACGMLPLLSQGELMFQQGVENNTDSPEPFPFCSFSSSASSLHAEKKKEMLQKSLKHLRADFCYLPHDIVPIMRATPVFFYYQCLAYIDLFVPACLKIKPDRHR